MKAPSKYVLRSLLHSLCLSSMTELYVYWRSGITCPHPKNERVGRIMSRRAGFLCLSRVSNIMSTSEMDPVPEDLLNIRTPYRIPRC